MLEAVRDFRDATGRQIGVKPAGGIRTSKDAIGYHARVQLERLDRGQTLKTQIDYPVQTWAFGDSLTAMANTNAVASNAPRFVPEDNINFFHGQNQAACISCGLARLRRGRSSTQ